MRVLRWVGLVLLVAVVGLAGFVWWNLHDRNPGSEFTLSAHPTLSVAARLRAGFGRRVINPDMSKPVWVAGFAHNRAATKIHDDLKAVAAKIVRTVKALGLSHFDLKYSNGTLPHDLMMKSIELYGTKVLPLVREQLD